MISLRIYPWSSHSQIHLLGPDSQPHAPRQQNAATTLLRFGPVVVHLLLGIHVLLVAIRAGGGQVVQSL
jgi:hypothetical protein